MAEAHRVTVFFYGTIMKIEALAARGVSASEGVPAKLSGFELSIRPRVNLIPSDQSYAYGALVRVTHDDLARLYAGLKETLGFSYLPEAVVAETLDGALRPAMCYLAQDMPRGDVDSGYVRQLAASVRELGFPEWYARHVESFVTPAE